jgi:hypothetical protein
MRLLFDLVITLKKFGRCCEPVEAQSPSSRNGPSSRTPANNDRPADAEGARVRA